MTMSDAAASFWGHIAQWPIFPYFVHEKVSAKPCEKMPALVIFSVVFAKNGLTYWLKWRWTLKAWVEKYGGTKKHNFLNNKGMRAANFQRHCQLMQLTVAYPNWQ
jgi:hypothetical protein